MAWRIEVATHFIDRGEAITFTLKASGVARSTWYDRKLAKKASSKDNQSKAGRKIPGYSINPNGVIVPDELIVKAIRLIRSKTEFLNGGGYHKIKHYLRRDFGYFVNHKKVYRLCRENNFLLPRRKKKRQKNNRISVNRTITGPNQLWEFDVKYGYIHGQNKFFFVMPFIDVFLRKIVGYHVGLSCKAKDIGVTLERALASTKGDKGQLKIRSDNGPQMTSNQFREYLEGLEDKLVHEFIPVGCPNKNAHVESFFSILETEFLQVRYFRSFSEAYCQTVEFINFYNGDRIHGSLKFQSPMEAEKAYLNGTLKIKNIRV